MDQDRGKGAARSANDDSPAGANENLAPSAGGVGDDPGAPGGMGGVRGGMPNPDGRPNGGVSPIQQDGDERE